MSIHQSKQQNLPIFANFYLGHIEKTTFINNPTTKPKLYLRYIDDILIGTDNIENIRTTINNLKNNSILHFTHELETNNVISFLDINIGKNNNKFITNVYTKPTNFGFCLNGLSECPLRYKISTIKSYVKRAFTHCSNYISLQHKIQRIKNMLSNNNYDQKIVDTTINKHWMKYYNDNNKNQSIITEDNNNNNNINYDNNDNNNNKINNNTDCHTHLHIQTINTNLHTTSKIHNINTRQPSTSTHSNKYDTISYICIYQTRQETKVNPQPVHTPT